jgi:hypothetical protein
VTRDPKGNSKTKRSRLGPRKSRQSPKSAVAPAHNMGAKKLLKALQVGVIPYSLGLDPSAIRKIEDSLPKGYVDTVSPAVGGGWRLVGQLSGLDCLIQPALRQVVVTGVADEKKTTDAVLNVLEVIREHLPTPHYLALTIGQTFHLAVEERIAENASVLIERRLLSQQRDPLRNTAYVVGLRYYFAEIYQSTITVDPLLADPRFLFLQYFSTRPGVFAATDIRREINDLRGKNVELLDSIIAFLFES